MQVKGCEAWVAPRCVQLGVPADRQSPRPPVTAVQMKGCEAWVALCASNTTKVAQCTKPGPVPKLPPTMTVREAINSLCSTHYMDGCYECEPGWGAASGSRHGPP